MRASSLFRSFGCLLLVGLSNAMPSLLTPEDTSLELAPRGGLVKRAPTCNTPSNRACWTAGFNISTDYEANFPATGVVRNYNFVITEVDNWVNPREGGTKRKAMLINGQFPGPNIVADWGDTVRVTVTNRLRINGTSIHWHGVRMLNNNVNDGTNGITECPIPPGASKVYTFRAEQYGSSWYHSHFSSQYANGVVGTIQFNGPASLPYDEDLGVFPITDWYYGAADQIQHSLIPPGTAPPPSDNVLFNGSHVNANGGGSYARVKLKRNKRHLLRIINTSVDNTFQVSLVNHQFTVVAADFVPVNAFTTSSLFLAVGQRYDVTIDANQDPANYWFNVTFSSSGLCGSSLIPKPAAIFQYDSAPSALPTLPGSPPPDHLCADTTLLTPIVTRTVPPAQFTATPSNSLDVVLTNFTWEGQQRVYWQVKGQDMNITWDEPTLEYLAKGNLSFPRRYNVFQVPAANTWSFWVIENTNGVPHPMHLHGHDFLILGRSPALANPFGTPPRPFNPAADTASLDFTNPVRRDTTMLPGNGWLVVAFRSDNPGAWLFHCHIAWHVSQGLSVQFLERVGDIKGTVKLEEIEGNCRAWESYYPTSVEKQFDSGLRI